MFLRSLGAVASRSVWILPISILVLAGIVVYFPGLSGPFLFDDLPNILNNEFIRLQDISQSALVRSAESTQAGPLGRPVANLSFALNYFFASGFDSTHFKLTNLAIHVVNGVLVYWFLRLVISRSQTRVIRGDSTSNPLMVNRAALIAAVLWLVHPIQLTSVLYVVQRMTSLSALFVLLALISYMHGRISFIGGNRNAVFPMLLGPLIFGGLGLLSKESAALLPVFILLLEFVLFSGESPWRFWKNIPLGVRRLVLIFATTALVSLAVIIVINHFAPGYAGRPFTFTERILTEPRVLFFYISLILVPRINAFSLHHDDIGISDSLFSPWTTGFSIAGILMLVIVAVRIRKKWPIVALGILWFFAAHLLESTVIALEIAHEHRNYLASLGVVLVLTFAIFSGSQRVYRDRAMWIFFSLLISLSAITTFARSSQWSNDRSLYTYESLHHPNSARAALELGGMLANHGQFQAAQLALQNAAELQPHEPSHLMWQQFMRTKRGLNPDAGLDDAIVARLTSRRLSATTIKSFGDISACLQSDCQSMANSVKRWIFAVVNDYKYTVDKSYFFYLLGINFVSQNQPAEAVKAFYYSYQLDNKFLHPLFSMASMYIQANQIEDAKSVLDMLKAANLKASHPRDKQIQSLQEKIEKLHSR